MKSSYLYYLQRYCKWKYITDIIFSMIAIGIILIYIDALFNAPIGVDTGAYLSIVNKLSKGMTPYVEFKLNYPPLSFYLLLIVKSVTGSYYSYEYAIGFLFIIQFINSALLYKTLRYFIMNNRVALFASSLFLIISYSFGGIFFILEPFVVFFGLLSILAIFRNTIAFAFLAGIFCGLGFLCKQYALGFLALLIGYLFIKQIFTKRRQYNKIFYVVLGFSSTIFIFVLCYYFYYKELINFIAVLSGGGYGERSLPLIFITFFKFSAPVMPVLLLVLFFYKDFPRAKKIIVLTSLLGIIIFALQFYFQAYRHYYVILLPFIVFLIAVSLDHVLTNGYKKYIIYVLLAISILFIVKESVRSYKNMHSWQNRKELRNLACFLNENIPNESTLVLFRNAKNNIMPQLYFLTDIDPPDIKNTPIAFYKKEDYDRLFRAADFALISVDDYNLIISDSASNLSKTLSSKEIIRQYNSTILLLR